jgi:glutaminase
MNQHIPQNIPTLPIKSSIQSYLEDLHRQFASLFEGEIASYIPELTRADPAWFGIALVTVDGHVYQVGDSLQSFTIQSVSKAITYGLALEDQGVDAVLAKVGVEPSGEAFNSISLDKETGRPLNPMINAGAIATTGLINGANSDAKLDRILRRFEDYVGHPVTIDEEVYVSERDTGHRNRAIAHLLRNADIIEGVPEPVVDLYFRQCSINVTAQDLALMGACLANSGVNPITSVVALKNQFVEKVLSVMTTCGMYDYSGSWVYSVGMPAKSGVGGGIMAVLPGQFGLGVFSPLLDSKGNSVRGLRVCETLSRDFGLHLLKVARATSTSVVRVFYDGSLIHSKRRRYIDERDFLKREGHRIQIYELQGELMFASTDALIRQVGNNWDKTDYLILDFHRVVDIDAASTRLLSSLLANNMNGGKCLLFTGAEDKYQFRRALRKMLGENRNNEMHRFAEADRALEWCEDQLLQKQVMEQGDLAISSLERQDLCYQFSEADFEFIRRVGILRHYAHDEIIFQTGAAGDSLFFLFSGLVDTVVTTKGGEELRLITLCADMSFGEFSLVSGEPRSAAARAVGAVHCLELPFAALDIDIKHKLTCNLARELSRRLNDETRALRIIG